MAPTNINYNTEIHNTILNYQSSNESKSYVAMMNSNRGNYGDFDDGLQHHSLNHFNVSPNKRMTRNKFMTNENDWMLYGTLLRHTDLQSYGQSLSTYETQVTESQRSPYICTDTEIDSIDKPLL